MLAKALEVDHGREVPDDEPMAAWSPAERQVARRVNASATLNGDLLLGHAVVFHVLDAALAGGADDERLLGLSPTSSAAAPSFEVSLAAVDALGEDIDDDVYTAITIETTRALRLRTALHLEPKGLLRGAALGGLRYASAWVQQQARPSAPET